MLRGNANEAGQKVNAISRIPAPHTFRKKSNFAIAIFSEAAAPVLRFSTRLMSLRKPSSPSEWRQGVLVGAGHIGDVLYNTASLPFLEEASPKCEWHLVAASPASEALANNPYITSCRPTLRSLASTNQIDAVVCYNSGGYWRELFQATRLGIPNRAAYIHKDFSGLVTFPITIRYPQPYPAYFRDLVGQLIDRKPDWPLRPIIYPTAENETKAERVWDEANLKNSEPVVACFMTSRQRSGVWPAEKFAKSVACLETESSVQTVICGTVADRRVLEELKAQFGLRAQITAGKLDLLSLGCFLRRCAVVLCPDSGPRHLANAVGTLVVFIRNFAVGKIETGTYLDTEIDAAPNLECLSPREQIMAFSLLKPEDVAARIVESLGAAR